MESQDLSSSICRSLDSPGWAGQCIPGIRCLIRVHQQFLLVASCSALFCPFFLIPPLLFSLLPPHLFMWLWISFSLGGGCRA